MSNPSDVWTHARGIGEAIVEQFLPSFLLGQEDALVFYGEGATLYFQGQELRGIDEIRTFLAGIAPFSNVHVAGFDVQPIPGRELSWSLIVATGQIGVSDRLASFHSTFCVQGRKEDCQAFIRSHSFTWT
jgi:hypothetical protein